jgi:hypothetical protein
MKFCECAYLHMGLFIVWREILIQLHKYKISTILFIIIFFLCWGINDNRGGARSNMQIFNLIMSEMN